MAELPHDEALALVAEIGAREREHYLEAILKNIEQTFGGEMLYPTAESRSAHLLYFMVRDHALLDGTKRGTVMIFEEYLRRNDLPLLPAQSVGQIMNDIEAGRGQAHQEQIVARICAELAAALAQE
jgi:prophage maintenance system killer protein